MERFIQQFRFYGEKDPKNYPMHIKVSHDKFIDTEAETLVNGAIFTQFTPIISLGIQALPGTKFYLNGNIGKDNAIIVGTTGIYELNLNGQVEINALSFDKTSIKNIAENPEAFLIVDILYEREEK